MSLGHAQLSCVRSRGLKSSDITRYCQKVFKILAIVFGMQFQFTVWATIRSTVLACFWRKFRKEVNVTGLKRFNKSPHTSQGWWQAPCLILLKKGLLRTTNRQNLMQESVQASMIVCLSVSQVFPCGGLVAQVSWSEVEEPLGGGT